MKTSDAGIEQIKHFEGFRTMPYRDVGGKWTVGYGHLMVPDDGCIEGSPITMGQATSLLRRDVTAAETAINAENLSLTQNEFDALVSFTYNLGTGAFKRSTLLKFLKQGNKEAASKEFLKWAMVEGKYNDGILNRRIAEQDCFVHANYKG